jgi:hypothetical protein
MWTQTRRRFRVQPVLNSSACSNSVYQACSMKTNLRILPIRRTSEGFSY